MSFNKKEEEEEIDSLFLLPIHSITSLPPFLLAAPQKGRRPPLKRGGGWRIGSNGDDLGGCLRLRSYLNCPIGGKYIPKEGRVKAPKEISRKEKNSWVKAFFASGLWEALLRSTSAFLPRAAIGAKSTSESKICLSLFASDTVVLISFHVSDPTSIPVLSFHSNFTLSSTYVLRMRKKALQSNFLKAARLFETKLEYKICCIFLPRYVAVCTSELS